MEHILIHRNFAENLRASSSILLDESNFKTNQEGLLELQSNIQERISSKILDWYKAIKLNQRIWTYKKKRKLRGFINILPIGNPIERSKAPDQHGLTMFDNFVPEACVGYYVAPQGQKPNDELYFLNFGEEPQGMNVNADGYIQLLYMARGFAYWQMALLSFQNNPTTDENAVEEFRHWMPIVFPDFKWEEFVALYEKVKIK